VALLGLATLTGLLAGCTPPGLPAPIAPTVTTTASTVTVPPTSVTIGIDGTTPGFNPHALADFSPVTTAIASLVLPSVSRYAADGTLVFDPSIVDSAGVSSTSPFTVTYQLNRSASWSDGTPVTGEDFAYLAAEMASAPGTVDPAGYQLITDVRSHEGGKVVDVVFSAPFAGWRTLFSDLLPAHLLKDAPGGWASALTAGIPVSANRYKLASVDRTTGEITLQRNDKYWAGVSGPLTVVVRTGDSGDLLAALGRGDLEAAQVRPSAQDAAALAAIPADRRVAVPEAGTLQLIMNTGAGPTNDPAVRRAIVAALGQSTAIAALDAGTPPAAGTPASTPGAPAGTPASTPGTSPASTPGASPAPTPGTASSTTGAHPAGGGPTPAAVPTRSMIALATTAVGTTAVDAVAGSGAPPDPARAAAELTDAGYHRAGVYVVRDGRPLVLSLSYPAADPRVAAVARVVQRELGLAGIDVDLVARDVHGLVGAAAAGSLDLALLTVARGSEDAVTAASVFGCPDPKAPPGSARRGNLSGYCSTWTQPVLEVSLTSGHGTEGVEDRLEMDRPVWPIAQPVDVIAVSPNLRGVVADAGTGWIFGGPFADLSSWPVS
jgi:ABC-type transport system substrate-binding protein